MTEEAQLFYIRVDTNSIIAEYRQNAFRNSSGTAQETSRNSGISLLTQRIYACFEDTDDEIAEMLENVLKHIIENILWSPCDPNVEILQSLLENPPPPSSGSFERSVEILFANLTEKEVKIFGGKYRSFISRVNEQVSVWSQSIWCIHKGIGPAEFEVYLNCLSGMANSGSRIKSFCENSDLFSALSFIDLAYTVQVSIFGRQGMASCGYFQLLEPSEQGKTLFDEGMDFLHTNSELLVHFIKEFRKTVPHPRENTFYMLASRGLPLKTLLILRGIFKHRARLLCLWKALPKIINPYGFFLDGKNSSLPPGRDEKTRFRVGAVVSETVNMRLAAAIHSPRALEKYYYELMEELIPGLEECKALEIEASRKMVKTCRKLSENLQGKGSLHRKLSKMQTLQEIMRYLVLHVEIHSLGSGEVSTLVKNIQRMWGELCSIVQKKKALLTVFRNNFQVLKVVQGMDDYSKVDKALVKCCVNTYLNSLGVRLVILPFDLAERQFGTLECARLFSRIKSLQRSYVRGLDQVEKRVKISIHESIADSFTRDMIPSLFVVFLLVLIVSLVIAYYLKQVLRLILSPEADTVWEYLQSVWA
ncbi:uncharacterized protein NEMAJ01_1837 [Nematocida major]|uniref:uncharacterized protein n=1 Tax=Nematocida major TaxID=1912982 RepID=UPI00200897EE|nr:uncharacterized protein NEMAJ01_1837 [Nematocida major]KAH9386941.1 hypothetical protein NEMAJ01_1837 [Nematocida major]